MVEVICSEGEFELIYNSWSLSGKDSEKIVRNFFSIDQEAFYGYGTIVVPKLGSSLTGYIPEDSEIRSASAFAPGRWDKMLSSMKPLKTGPF